MIYKSTLISNTQLSLLKIFIAGLAFTFLLPCVSAQTADSVNINNIKFAVPNDGGLFKTPTEFRKFQINSANGKATISTGGLWLSAKVDSQKRVAAIDYFNSDYSSGPVIDDSTLYQSAAYQNRYNRVWKVTRQQIEDHRKNWNTPGYTAPDAIKNWPGNGNTSRGESRILAPFWDVNADSSYNPSQGDYPQIRGDAAIFTIFNDVNRDSALTAGNSLGVEVHAMVYAYDSASFPALHNSVFVNYRIYNRSAKTLDSLTAGTWIDHDIGYPGDDIVGSDSANAIAYCYNADANDETPNGFGSNPPAMGTHMFGGKAGGFMYYNRAGNYNGPMALTGPDNKAEFYRYLHSTWKDGKSLIVETPSGAGNNGNGDGYSLSGGSVTKWAYNEQTNWYESPNNSADKRSLFLSKPRNLQSGEDACLDLVFTYGRDTSGTDLLSSVDVVKSGIGNLKTFFQNQNFNCPGRDFSIAEWQKEQKRVKIYPNPAHDMLYVNADFDIQTFKVYNISGQEVMKRSFENSTSVKLATSDWGHGLYLLKITGKSGQRAQSKILVK